MRRALRRSSWPVLSLLAIALVVSVGLWGCSTTDENPVAVEQTPEATLYSAKNAQVQSVMAIQNRHTARLMADPEIIGTATGLTDDGRVAVLVLATTGRAANAVPRTLDGVPVRVMRTDPIVALKGKPPPPEPPADHTARQTRPIELGVSGGNSKDLANGFCCSGTLGALVTDGTFEYILSNSHVFAGDVAASAGDLDIATIGDDINQPGLIDVFCQDISADYVATLSTLSTLNPGGSPTGNVDAALAQVVAGQVSSSILEIGNISAATTGASVRQKVKKSGRTTGLTRSRVDGINATVTVGYSDECNGQTFTNTFTGQILIKNQLKKGGSFIAGGDSGSLMVEDLDPAPRAVGLLYAGSATTAVANPIADVLGHLGVSMVP
ncbi:MAG: S1 family peptidase [Candidatus Krumholzibacteria bacterium]|nr:S1 family peptidase [Candidatus Krumholzibacteria bacterium]